MKFLIGDKNVPDQTKLKTMNKILIQTQNERHYKPKRDGRYYMGDI